jgi:hypothetical protein
MNKFPKSGFTALTSTVHNISCAMNVIMTEMLGVCVCGEEI